MPEDPRTVKLRPLSILLFGDSVDFRIVKFFCNLALDLEPEDFGYPGVEDRLKLQGICRTPKLTVAKYHISSVSLEGPYWNNINYPPLQSIREVRCFAREQKHFESSEKKDNKCFSFLFFHGLFLKQIFPRSLVSVTHDGPFWAAAGSV